jgi:hypothetical protein
LPEKLAIYLKETVTMSVWSLVLVVCFLSACSADDPSNNLARDILTNADFKYVVAKAKEIVQSGLNAGDGYNEVWIRDFNTFMRLACDVHPPEMVRENLLVFFRLQGDDGNIIDGFVSKERANVDYDYMTSELEPRYIGHKNSVETDQEASLLQATYTYIDKTADNDLLRLDVGGKTVAQRMEDALDFLMQHRFSKQYGLIFGATTVDWGDVQPEDAWGVDLSDSTHYAIDIYDNAMLIIAITNFVEMLPGKARKWLPVRDKIAQNVREHLWDDREHKFIPHIYLAGSPFPTDFAEGQIFYHGGTAVAIAAGLLTRREIEKSLNQMVENVERAGASSIGLTVYPAYPTGFFKNPAMVAYGYQNGGDWTWFGGRMIQQLIKNDFIAAAYQQMQPMTKRVEMNEGFYEWYTLDNQPQGSGTYRGSAGVLYDAIQQLYLWARNQQMK